MKRQLVTYDQGTPVTKQHTKPCSDCPFARDSLPGWLGSSTPEEWMADVHGESKVECHTLIGAQCAGSSIYRANVFKDPRDRTIVRLPRNKVNVFASPQEFLEYHHAKSLSRPKPKKKKT